MKVPFLKVEAIDSAVGELLRNFSKKTGKPVLAPVPVEDILEKYLKVKLEITDLVKMLGAEDVLGAVWFDEGIVRVHERLVDQEGRFSFTIGHELGHWILHRPLVEAEKVAPALFAGGVAPPAFVCRSSGKPPAEWQADQFAARLLMPARMVRDAFFSSCGQAPVGIAGLRDPNPASAQRWRDVATTVIHAGKFSNVSNEAMRYRLNDLGLVREPSPQATLL